MTEQPRPLVLVIEDDRHIQSFLRISLGSQDYKLVETGLGKEGVALAASHVPDVVILDLGLPDIDGLEVIRRIREWSRVPIIVLSARGPERDKVAALDVGADDYLTKPFGVGELLARIRVSLRRAARPRAGEEGETHFRVGDLEIDLERRRVQLGAEELHLTPIEYRLLAVLVRHAGKVLTHNFLLQEVWGPMSADQTQYLRVYMAALRRKIEREPTQPRYLLTEVGVGYRLVEE